MELILHIFQPEAREMRAHRKQETGAECKEQEETLSSTHNNTAVSIIQDQEYQPNPPLQKTVEGSECTHSTGESLKNGYQNQSKYTESKKDTVLSEVCAMVPKCHQYHSAEKEEEQSNRIPDIEEDYQGCSKTQGLTAKGQQVEVSPTKPIGGSGSGLASETSWSQSEDVVQVIICLADVEQYKCHLLSSQLVFM